MNGYQRRFYRNIMHGLLYLFCVFAVSFMQPVLAAEQEVNQFCEIEKIRDEFKEYVPKDIGPDKMIKEIQRQIVASGYRKIDIDSVEGTETDKVLIDYCKDLRIRGAEDLQSEVIKFWESRALPAPKPYYQWLPETRRDQSQAKTSTDDPQIPQQIKDNLSGTEEIKGINGKIYRNKQEFQLALKALSLKELFETIKKKEKIEQGEEPESSEVLKKEYSKIEEAIIKQAEIQPLTGSKAIHLSGGGCGCSRDFSAEVYGFYPYWLVGEDADSESDQVVDFSILDRIGFYALTFTEDGEIDGPENWGDNIDFASFINVAHKHRVAVDLALFASDWQNWEGEREINVKNNIGSLLNKKFKAKHSFGQAILSHAENTALVSVDGITLVIENKVEKGSNANLADVLDRVLPKKANSMAPKINLVVDLIWNDSDSTGASRTGESRASRLLKDLDEKLKISNNKESRVARILTLLPEPTAKSKKKLRRLIEDTFPGEKRRNVLRKIIPIVSSEGIGQEVKSHEVDQFVDDLIYFEDNFAGIGLWPMPVGPEGDKYTKNVSDKIIEQFQTGSFKEDFASWFGKGEDGLRERTSEWIGGFLEGGCDAMCLNRFWIWFILALVFTSLFLYWLIGSMSCKLKLFSGWYLVGFFTLLVGTLLFSSVMMWCDTVTRKYLATIFLLLFFVTLIMTGLHQIKKAETPRLP